MSLVEETLFGTVDKVQDAIERYRAFGYKQRDAEIVRCGSCKFWNEMWKGCKRNPSVEQWNPDDFCSYGCRKGETDDEAD